jgi:hypothetical protein
VSRADLDRDLAGRLAALNQVPPCCPECDAPLRWAGDICTACVLPPPDPAALAWHRIERLGGLATVDGKRGMYVRIGRGEED